MPLGSVTLDGTFSYSDRAEQDYQDLSLGQMNRLGYDWDNFGPSHYALAVQVADIAANRGDNGHHPAQSGGWHDLSLHRSRPPTMPTMTHRACAAIRWPRSACADLAPA